MYLNFQEISRQIPFIMLLDHYGLDYSVREGAIIGKGKFDFIVDTEKNVFLCPQDKEIKGGVINFCSFYEGINLREAAKKLQDLFIKEHKPKKEIPELTLEYDKFLEKKGYSKEFCEKMEVGRYKGKGIMTGRIVAKCYDINSNKVGYVGYDDKKDKWLYPKGFVRPIYNANNVSTPYCILTAGLFDTLNVLQCYPFVVGLLGVSMSESQQSIMALRYQRVLLIHKAGENVRNRLSYLHCFVKWVDYKTDGITQEEIKGFF